LQLLEIISKNNFFKIIFNYIKYKKNYSWVRIIFLKIKYIKNNLKKSLFKKAKYKK
jgi:hypothetical protein